MIRTMLESLLGHVLQRFDEEFGPREVTDSEGWYGWDNGLRGESHMCLSLVPEGGVLTAFLDFSGPTPSRKWVFDPRSGTFHEDVESSILEIRDLWGSH